MRGLAGSAPEPTPARGRGAQQALQPWLFDMLPPACEPAGAQGRQGAAGAPPPPHYPTPTRPPHKTRTPTIVGSRRELGYQPILARAWSAAAAVSLVLSSMSILTSIVASFDWGLIYGGPGGRPGARGFAGGALPVWLGGGQAPRRERTARVATCCPTSR